MSLYVLVLWLGNAVYGGGLATVQMYDEQSCKEALVALQQANPQINGLCVPYSAKED